MKNSSFPIYAMMNITLIKIERMPEEKQLWMGTIVQRQIISSVICFRNRLLPKGKFSFFREQCCVWYF